MRTLRRGMYTIVPLLIVGCGGGGGSQPPGRSWDVTLHWPAQTRGMEYAQSIVVALEYNGNSISTNVSNRPSGTASTTKVHFALDSAPMGTYMFHAMLKSGADGSGATIGNNTYSATASQVDVANVPSDFTLSIVGPSSATIGEEIQLHCDGAKNGSVVSVPPGLVTWLIASGGTGDGVISKTGIFRATKAGTVRVQATIPDEAGPQLSATLTISAH